MGVLHDLLTTLAGARVQDVHVPGYLETAYGTPEFRSLSGTLYLDLGERFLRLDGSRSSGSLTLEIVTEIAKPAALEGEDDEFVTAAIGDLFFDTSGPLPLTRVRYAVNNESDTDRGIVRCAEFRLGKSICLFFDPMVIHGIQLGVNHEYEAWQRDQREREREIFGFVEEYTWESDVS